MAELFEHGALDGDVELLAVSQQDWCDGDYRDWARARLAEHAGHVPEATRDRLVVRLAHQQGDVTAPVGLTKALSRVSGRPVIYLALPNPSSWRPSRRSPRSSCRRGR